MEKKICFVVMGFGKKQDPKTNRTIDLDVTFQKIIKPALRESEYECIRGDELLDSSLIDHNMYGLLYAARLVIADISTYNPNALYELGVRHALKPFSTIIMKEDSEGLPFDINHSKTLHYKHLGNIIEDNEAKRVKQELLMLIHAVSEKESTDSPLYTFFPDISPPVLPEGVLDRLISSLKTKERNIYSLTKKAKEKMSSDCFTEAGEIWNQLSEMVKDDFFYVQQHAICICKGKKPDESLSLREALKIMKPLFNSNDSESLGIIGSIYKRLWLLERNMDYLRSSIDYYRRGWEIYKDHYTGGNYAECMQYEVFNTDDTRERTFYIVAIEKLRKEIIDYIQLNWDNKDSKWKYASLANCHRGLDNSEKADFYESKFKEEKIEEWEWQSYLFSKENISKYINEISSYSICCTN
ncbi:tetratricopeptide repeat-containing protein [uncultured Akkermansia sp.]|jgi:hypothetical protein|uniref:tetratricopeptide repeat-containing protein n=1 Tax=uncultured Akkermansia sp. TaxID=512294 RepID=UPI0025FE30B1|nr:tetratricopeptide repeat-containing protein [uncultured Akkermansia sp.]